MLSRTWQPKRQDDPNSCWLWTSYRTPNGYGLSGGVYVHRAAYKAFVGAIPAGLHIDHLCRVRACYNPAHLEAVTQAENNQRASRARTHCRRGHTWQSGQAVTCRPCRQERSTETQARINELQRVRRRRASQLVAV